MYYSEIRMLRRSGRWQMCRETHMPKTISNEDYDKSIYLLSKQLKQYSKLEILTEGKRKYNLTLPPALLSTTLDLCDSESKQQHCLEQ